VYSSIERKTTSRIRTAVSRTTTFIHSFIQSFIYLFIHWLLCFDKKHKRNILSSFLFLYLLFSILCLNILNCRLYVVLMSRETYIYIQHIIYLCSGNLNSWKALVAIFFFFIIFSEADFLAILNLFPVDAYAYFNGNIRWQPSLSPSQKKHKLLPKAMIRLNKSYLSSFFLL